MANDSYFRLDNDNSDDNEMKCKHSHNHERKTGKLVKNNFIYFNISVGNKIPRLFDMNQFKNSSYNRNHDSFGYFY